MLRHKIQAGMTGWAQIHGYRGDTSIEERLRYDLEYIQRWSLLFDVKILLLTLIRGFLHKEGLRWTELLAAPLLKSHFGQQERFETDLECEARLVRALHHLQADRPALGVIERSNRVAGKCFIPHIIACRIGQVPPFGQVQSKPAVDEIDVGVPSEAPFQKEGPVRAGGRHSGIGDIEWSLVESYATSALRVSVEVNRAAPSSDEIREKRAGRNLRECLLPR